MEVKNEICSSSVKTGKHFSGNFCASDFRPVSIGIRIHDRNRVLAGFRYKSLLAREDVQAALVARGLDPQEARSRIDGLSDAEAVSAADRFEKLPEGGGVLETILIISFLVFLILLITDIAGYTDIFPFVHPMRK